MKLTKIYLFASVFNQYGVIDNFTEELAAALSRQGVETKIIIPKKEDPRSFLNEILSDPPDCTLSFNGLLPDAEGRFLCDFIQIPHVACLTDAPHHFLSLVKSPLNILTCIDSSFCQTFKDLNFSQTFFFPHAASPSLISLNKNDFKYEVLLLNSFIDYEAIRASWTNSYSPDLIKVLEESAERTIAEKDLTYMQAFVATMDKALKEGASIDPLAIDYPVLFDTLECYMQGKALVQLIQSIQGVDLHFFGSNSEELKKYVKNNPSIHIHSAVSFTEAIDCMKHAKVLLSCTPKYKHGAHERIFSGLLAGAAVFALDTPYLSKQFQDEENIVLFSLNDLEFLNQKIHTYIHGESKRQALVDKGRQKVLDHHTWDQRAKQLIQELPPLLEAIQANQE